MNASNENDNISENLSEDVYAAYNMPINEIVYKKEQDDLVNRAVELFNYKSNDNEPIRRVLMNTSATGSGKTVDAILIAIKMNYRILIYCPTGATMVWINHLNKMNAMSRLVSIASLKIASLGQYYNINSILKRSSTNTTSQCVHYMMKVNIYDKKKYYVWDDEMCEELFINTLIVVDECHQITTKSQRSMFFVKLYEYLKFNDGKGSRFAKWNTRIMLQTATSSEVIDRYARIFYLFDILPSEDIKLFRDAINKTLKEAHTENKNIDDIHIIKEMLKDQEVPYVLCKPRPRYPFYNNIKVELFVLDEETTQKIKQENLKIASILKTSHKNSKKRNNMITVMAKKVEILMIPLYVTIIKTMLNKGYHVVVFMGFLDTIQELKTQLARYDPVVITGSVSSKALRDEYQTNFMNGKIRLLIITVGVGSNSISLHDIRGPIMKSGNPTGAHASVLSIVYYMVEFVQMIGRLYREGIKSDVYQLLPLVKGTNHEVAVNNIVNKMSILEKFNEDISLSDTIYNAVQGSGKRLIYDDISSESTSDVIECIIPDITEDTFREKLELLEDILPESITTTDSETIYSKLKSCKTKKSTSETYTEKLLVDRALFSTKVVKLKMKGNEIVQGCDVYIGKAINFGLWRGVLENSKWANKYKCIGVNAPYTLTESLRLYERDIRSSDLINDLEELRGKVLGCWCSDDNNDDIIDNPKCHGHILVKLIHENDSILKSNR